MPRLIALTLLAACGSTAPQPTVPTETPALPPVAVPAPSPATEPDLPMAFALVASHQQDSAWFGVPVACVTHDGAVQAGQDCASSLRGQPASLSAGATVLGTPQLVTCVPTGTEASALAAPIEDEPGSEAAWGYLGTSIPSGWHIAQRATVDDTTAGFVRDEIRTGSTSAIRPEQAEQAVITERLDLNGTRVLRAHVDSPDPDKPGNSALFLVGNDIIPLPTQGLDLNGTVTTPGAFPLPNGAFLLVLTSQWMGGQGVHAIEIAPDSTKAIGEWACGT